jgi:phosphoglycerol geranylgeranyltransferase
MRIHNYIQQQLATNTKMLAILIDPDDYTNEALLRITLKTINDSNTSFVLIGGSVLLTNTNFDTFVRTVQSMCAKPVILFPGDGKQINKHADALLLLSLVSGRNPQYLIGEHVQSAIALKESKLELLPTGYILVDAGHATSVSTVTSTNPIAANDIKLVVATALAATQLGMTHIYLEAGSGAQNSVNTTVITAVKNELQPQHALWVGGGINNPLKAKQSLDAGANIIVVGNAVVNNHNLILELSPLFKAK